MRKFAVIGLTALTLSIVGCGKEEEASMPAPVAPVEESAPVSVAPETNMHESVGSSEMEMGSESAMESIDNAGEMMQEEPAMAEPMESEPAGSQE